MYVLQRLPVGETAVGFVPELDLFLAADSAEVHFSSLSDRWEVNQSSGNVAYQYSLVRNLSDAFFEALPQPVLLFLHLSNFALAAGGAVAAALALQDQQTAL